MKLIPITAARLRARDTSSKAMKMNRMNTIMFDLSEVLIRGLIGIDEELSDVLKQPHETILSKFGGDQLQSELVSIGILSDENENAHKELKATGESAP